MAVRLRRRKSDYERLLLQPGSPLRGPRRRSHGRAQGRERDDAHYVIENSPKEHSEFARRRPAARSLPRPRCSPRDTDAPLTRHRRRSPGAVGGARGTPRATSRTSRCRRPIPRRAAAGTYRHGMRAGMYRGGPAQPSPQLRYIPARIACQCVPRCGHPRSSCTYRS